jgi:hypothetical protein
MQLEVTKAAAAYSTGLTKGSIGQPAAADIITTPHLQHAWCNLTLLSTSA